MLCFDGFADLNEPIFSFYIGSDVLKVNDKQWLHVSNLRVNIVCVFICT